MAYHLPMCTKSTGVAQKTHNMLEKNGNNINPKIEINAAVTAFIMKYSCATVM